MAEKTRKRAVDTRATSTLSSAPGSPTTKRLPIEIETCLDKLRARPNAATEVLRKHVLIPEDATPTVEALTTGLLHLAVSSKPGAMLIECLCAFSLYAQEIHINTLVDSITTKLAPIAGIQAGLLDHRDDQQQRLNEMLDTQERLNSTVEGTVGRLTAEVRGLIEGQKLLTKEIEGVRRLQNELTNATGLLQTTTAKAEEALRQTPAARPGAPDGIRPTYAATVTHILPTSHSLAVNRQEAQFRKVLIDIHRDVDVSGVSAVQLTEQELVQKAMLALELMRDAGHPHPDGMRFLTVKRLRHGGLLYKLNTKEAALWLQRPENMQPFTTKFGHDASITAKNYACLLRNAPVYLHPDDPRDLRDLEAVNGWNPNELVAAHWIKPIDKRRQGQQHAHLIIKLSTPQRANEAIMQGIAVHGRHLPVEKLRKEARRCLRCQRLEPSHLARDCDWDIDICGTCGQDHPTRECNTGKLRCMNCNSEAHASWSRTCPAFVEATRKIQNANKLERYRFFPLIDDPSTWDHIDAPDLGPTPPTSHPTQLAEEPTRSPRLSSWDAEVEAEHRHEAEWRTHTNRRVAGPRAQSPPVRRDPPSHGANAIPIERTRPRTMSFRDNTGQRQSTLTREGGFSAGPSRPRNLSESRPPPLTHHDR